MNFKHSRLRQLFIVAAFFFISYEACGYTKEESQTSEAKAGGFNQIIGTQAIGTLYGCTGKCTVLEAAREMLTLGSRMIKTNVVENNKDNKAAIDAILDMPFDTYFFWWRSNGHIWYNGFSEESRKKEFQATYDFARKLLTRYKDTNKTFFLGNWEGDWYLLAKKENCGAASCAIESSCTTEPTEAITKNMAAWLDARQEAIDKAKADDAKQLSPSKAKIYLYVEANCVLAAKNNNKIRVVNGVIPKMKFPIDYVSYSAYDVQQKDQHEIDLTLNYIEAKLKPKPDIKGRRVFIGEMGMQAKAYKYNELEHEKKNRAIMLKFLKAKVPYILYWQIYNNEKDEAGNQQGFWLIDNKNKKWPLYYTLDGLYKYQETEAAKNNNTSYDFILEKSIEYLERHTPSAAMSKEYERK